MLYTVGEPSSTLIEERIFIAFQEEDAARRAYLDTLIREGSKCRFCGGGVSDSRLKTSPGLCLRAECKRRAARGEPVKVLAFVSSRQSRRPRP
jgi:hypothetical protein